MSNRQLRAVSKRPKLRYVLPAVLLLAVLIIVVFLIRRPLLPPLHRFDFLVVADDDQLDMCTVLPTGERRCTSHLWRMSLEQSSSGVWSVAGPTTAWVLTGREHRADRGMELSTLTAWRGTYYVCDDRTGTTYELVFTHTDVVAVPRVQLNDGDGTTGRPLKCEWSFVDVDDTLVVGSIGKPFHDPVTGAVVNNGPLFVKRIGVNTNGDYTVAHEDWTDRFASLDAAAGVAGRGYLWHEAVYRAHDGALVALPRRVSGEPYDEVSDSVRGGNIAIIEREEGKVAKIEFTALQAGGLRGFSAAKPLSPALPGLALALRTEEEFPAGSVAGTGAEPYRMATFATLVNVETGEVLMEETLISNTHKFEGIEIIRDN